MGVWSCVDNALDGEHNLVGSGLLLWRGCTVSSMCPGKPQGASSFGVSHRIRSAEPGGSDGPPGKDGMFSGWSDSWCRIEPPVLRAGIGGKGPVSTEAVE